ncbi:MAG: hypothetical protein PHV30_02255 [Candidatus Margulisbacteria bacterium]|nr:hypothetical protein [Candidatus Margulisiibacteriota bacterium]
MEYNLSRRLVFIIISIIVFMFVALLQLSINYKLDYTRQSLNSELKHLKDTNYELSIKLSSDNDLNEVYKYATQTLEMGFPEKVIYVYE